MLEKSNIKQIIRQLAVDHFYGYPENYPMEEGCPTVEAFDKVKALAVEYWEGRTIGESLRDETLGLTMVHYTDWVMDAFEEHIGEGSCKESELI